MGFVWCCSTFESLWLGLKGSDVFLEGQTEGEEGRTRPKAVGSQQQTTKINEGLRKGQSSRSSGGIERRIIDGMYTGCVCVWLERVRKRGFGVVGGRVEQSSTGE